MRRWGVGVEDCTERDNGGGGIKPGIRGPSMVTGGLIGVMGGFIYAYQNSAGRLMGFFPNDAEVARYKKSNF
ncbi:NADH-ubiquinone oxidoreductase 20.9 kDa subunit [Tanacetum coccineum]